MTLNVCIYPQSPIQTFRLHVKIGFIPHMPDRLPILKTMSGAIPKNEGETEIHRRCKSEIYDTLLRSPRVENVRLERYLKEVRPDISAYINGVPVAIEAQISNLSLDDIVRRTKAYARRGIHVLWLAQWTFDLDDGQYSPQSWERWVHATYFGRAYYWVGGTLVVPYHFDPFLLHVKESEWMEPGGRKACAGGYSRHSLRYKAPVRGGVLDILKDFGPRERAYWKGGDLEIPHAKLFCDSGPRFWTI